MATRIETVLIDDLDGDTTKVSTHRLSLDNIVYEIDLTPGNLQRLRAALEPFTCAARRLPANSTRRRAATGSTSRTSGGGVR